MPGEKKPARSAASKVFTAEEKAAMKETHLVCPSHLSHPSRCHSCSSSLMRCPPQKRPRHSARGRPYPPNRSEKAGWLCGLDHPDSCAINPPT